MHSPNYINPINYLSNLYLISSSVLSISHTINDNSIDINTELNSIIPIKKLLIAIIAEPINAITKIVHNINKYIITLFDNTICIIFNSMN